MNEKTKEDYFFMKKAISLSKKGIPYPNPHVGAIIVKNKKIIGKGYHKKAGENHAEINAINSVKNKQDLIGSTLYVTLEPCSHYGKTPPCTTKIIKSKISRVVFSANDPTKKVNGKKILKKNNIPVSAGIFKENSIKINEIFFHFSKNKIPFVSLKVASSKNGKIGIFGKKIKITNKKSDLFSHRLRTKYDSILVGINTILSDNPKLTSRIKNKRNPLKIILDSKLQIPLNANVLKDKNILILTLKNSNKIKKQNLQKKGIEIISFGNKINLKKLLKYLAKKEITSVLIEGGTKTHTSFLKEGLVNKIYFFKSKKIIKGNTVSVFSRVFLKKFIKKEKYFFGSDKLDIFYKKSK